MLKWKLCSFFFPLRFPDYKILDKFKVQAETFSLLLQAYIFLFENLIQHRVWVWSFASRFLPNDVCTIGQAAAENCDSKTPDSGAHERCTDWPHECLQLSSQFCDLMAFSSVLGLYQELLYQWFQEALSRFTLDDPQLIPFSPCCSTTNLSSNFCPILSSL